TRGLGKDLRSGGGCHARPGGINAQFVGDHQGGLERSAALEENETGDLIAADVIAGRGGHGGRWRTGRAEGGGIGIDPQLRDIIRGIANGGERVAADEKNSLVGVVSRRVPVPIDIRVLGDAEIESAVGRVKINTRAYYGRLVRL